VDKRKNYIPDNFLRKLDIQHPELPPAPVEQEAEAEALPPSPPKLRVKKINKKLRLQPEPDAEPDAEVDAEPEEAIVMIPKREVKPRFKKGIIELGDQSQVLIGDTFLSKRIPKPVRIQKLRVSKYFLNNREFFVPFIQKYLKNYKEDMIHAGVKMTCEDLKRNQEEVADVESTILVNQKIVRDYISSVTPYRGLLLMHGLGSGKTRSAIVITEGFLHSNPIIIMLPASLRRNFMEEIKKYGNVLFRKNNYWEFIALPAEKSAKDKLAEQLSSILKLSVETIVRMGGAWLVNSSKPPNYAELPPQDKQKLNDQLDKMIENKYKFINYNGLRKDKFAQLTNNLKNNIFDNSVVVIDEAHNFISRIVNKLNKIKKTQNLHTTKNLNTLPLFLQMYELLMDAQNARVVFLTGTPIINYPNEMAILFNILRGYIRTFTFPLSATRTLSSETISSFIPNDVDYIKYNSSLKTLVITRNPLGFVSHFSPPPNLSYEGVEGKAGEGKAGEGKAGEEKIAMYHHPTDAEFVQQIQTELTKHGIHVGKPSIQEYTALPDRLDTFLEMFLNKDTGELINLDKLKRRIIGLTSYFKSAQEELLPKYDALFDYHVLKIPMSNYQFKIYEKARQEERKREKSAKRNNQVKLDANGLYKEPTSTYRIFSRLYCNFVMPMPPGRPLPAKFAIKEQEVPTETSQKPLPQPQQPQPQAHPHPHPIQTRKVKICPPEKEINPNTGNCVLKCKEGHERNAEFKCVKTRKVPKAPEKAPEKVPEKVPEKAPEKAPEKVPEKVPEKAIKECPEGKELNPKTGRCVLKCKDGQVRNEDFKCVKAKKGGDGDESEEAEDEPEDEPEEAAEEPKDESAETVVGGYVGGMGGEGEEMEEDITEDAEEELEEKGLVGEDGEVEGDVKMEVAGGQSYLEEMKQALEYLKQHQSSILSPEGLVTYSPKMLAMLENITNEEHVGGHLVYSQFRTMEGIGIFCLVLEANGFTQFKIKKDNGRWKVAISEANKGKRTYALYTGTEDSEEREIIRNIYNGSWKDVPSEISTYLLKKSKNNLRGEIIKVFMITSSGSEGISLKNTRYVHAMDPYWHPVRLEQVIGRARRICSHEELPIALQTVEVFLYLMAFSKEQLASEEAIELKLHDTSKRNPTHYLTTDEALFEIATIKGEIAGKLLTAMKETSIDCSIHVKSTQKENLTCLHFGPNPDTQDFSYQPDITQDQNDKMKQLNQRLITWKAQEIIIQGVKRVLRVDTNEIYDWEVYQRMLQNPNYHPIPLGRLVKENDQYKVIQ